MLITPEYTMEELAHMMRDRSDLMEATGTDSDDAIWELIMVPAIEFLEKGMKDEDRIVNTMSGTLYTLMLAKSYLMEDNPSEWLRQKTDEMVSKAISIGVTTMVDIIIEKEEK